MARYAIGDIQGCKASLDRLLATIAFSAEHDTLWLTGDLVNRGPRSLDVLRWAKGLGDAVTTILGNHDLHLLARVAGTAAEKKRDTLDDVLHAPDRDELVDWLRARPVAHLADGEILIHAGLHPAWSVATSSIGGSPRAWWSSLAEVQARFDETAGHREFDCGLSRPDAEAVASHCILVELRHAGLTREEAQGVLDGARNRQRMMTH